MILHCISSEHESPKEIYKIVRNELKKHNESLLKKPEVILFTKADMVDGRKLESDINLFKKTHKNVLSVSVIDDLSIKELSGQLVKILRKL